MKHDDRELVPVFMPALGTVLIRAEDIKGEPLSLEEVIRIRDEAACIMMEAADARKMDESRGYRDIDPEGCWWDWQHLRREMGRKPDFDPGPRMNGFRSGSPEYQQTIRNAHATLDQFRKMLPSDGSPRQNAMVKTKIEEGKRRAFMWLSNTRLFGSSFLAKLFEVPGEFRKFHVGQELEVTEESLLDWMVNDAGVLHGGFSIRYHRFGLPEDERAEYDDYIGVTKYA